MKKHIYTVVAFAVFAASALASQSTEFDVRVPFAFRAGTVTLPAGTYKITEVNPGVILIRGDKGAVFVPRATMVPDTTDAGKASFLFHRAGDQYVLGEVNSEK